MDIHSIVQTDSSISSLSPFISLDSEDEALFSAHLFRHWRETFGFGCKSVFDRDIDLYGDLVERNLSFDNPVLTWIDRDQWVSVGYIQIYEEISTLCSLWLSNSIKGGDSICILCLNPYNRLISLLSAFRLGLIPLVFDPSGPITIQNVLESCPTDHIHVESGLMESIPEKLKRTILKLNLKESQLSLYSARYPTDAVALRLLNPYTGSSITTIEISAQDLFLRIIRDGHYILRLTRGSRWATHVSPQDSTSPLVELTSIFCGASLTYLNPQMTSTHLKMLIKESFDLIGINRAIIQPLIEMQNSNATLGEWKRWFRSPLDAQHILEWQNFSKTLKLDLVPHADLHWATSSIGIAFGSEWSTDLLAFDVYPSPGQSWQLGDLVSPDTPVKGNSGRFVSLLRLEDRLIEWPTPFILSRYEHAYRFLGCYPSGRLGIAFPEELVLRCLKAPGCWHAIVEIPTAMGSQFVLVAFMDIRSKGELHQLIIDQVGTFAVPDQIELIPYVPKLTDQKEIDHGWVKQLYTRGEFERRRKIPVYEALSKVKMLALGKSNV